MSESLALVVPKSCLLLLESSVGNRGHVTAPCWSWKQLNLTPQRGKYGQRRVSEDGCERPCAFHLWLRHRRHTILASDFQLIRISNCAISVLSLNLRTNFCRKAPGGLTVIMGDRRTIAVGSCRWALLSLSLACIQAGH